MSLLSTPLPPAPSSSHIQHPSSSARLGARSSASEGAFQPETLPTAGRVGQAPQAARTLPKELLERVKCPNKAAQPVGVSQKGPCLTASNISLMLHCVRKLSLLGLIRWDDFVATRSSGAGWSRTAGLILRNARKRLHRVAV